ncbi:hypothetical protein B7P43_G12796 [Cryptotermes secundus]|uniref:DUF4817 domain-containing protein n=1 Tax=Cryptotermes secundus TaxID=105785 RepID=A0A2J7QGL9_9NEOP|nr:hypothetical protein B7P43_G12796 [Cryptotermes secundus]
MEWSGAQHVFVVETFLKNRESVIATQRAFRTHFELRRRNRIPTQNTILRWAASFHATSSTLKKKSPGWPGSAHMPANVEAVRQSVVQSPQQSARKHAAALRLSDAMVRHILHLDLKFHPYTMATVQELHAGDWENCVNSCQHILASVPLTVILLTSDEAHFHLSGCVDKQNFRYWAWLCSNLNELAVDAEDIRCQQDAHTGSPERALSGAHHLEEIAAIPPDMTLRVKNNFRKRLNVCIRSQGCHMDDIVFHK